MSTGQLIHTYTYTRACTYVPA